MKIFCKLVLFLLLIGGVTLQAFEARLGKLDLADNTARQAYKSARAVCEQEKLSPDPFIPVAAPQSVTISSPVEQVQAACPVLVESLTIAGTERSRAPPAVS